MDNKHTPGPWFVKKSASHNGYTVSSADPDNGVDVSVFAPYGRRENERQTQAFADARLIAAAPDLLAALEAILAKHDDRDGLSDLWPKEAAAARTVIAQACGEG